MGGIMWYSVYKRWTRSLRAQFIASPSQNLPGFFEACMESARLLLQHAVLSTNARAPARSQCLVGE